MGNEKKQIQKQTFFSRIKGVIRSPSRTFEEIVENGGVNQAGWIVLLVALLSILFSLGLYLFEIEDKDDFTESIGLGIKGIISWIIGSGVVTLIGRGLFKGKGNFKEIRTATGFAQLPLIIFHSITIILVTLTNLISPSVALGSIITILIGLLALVCIIWTIILNVIGVKAAHRFDSYWRAVLTLFMPLIVLTPFFVISIL